MFLWPLLPRTNESSHNTPQRPHLLGFSATSSLLLLKFICPRWKKQTISKVLTAGDFFSCFFFLSWRKGYSRRHFYSAGKKKALSYSQWVSFRGGIKQLGEVITLPVSNPFPPKSHNPVTLFFSEKFSMAKT